MDEGSHGNGRRINCTRVLILQIANGRPFEEEHAVTREKQRFSEIAQLKTFSVKWRLAILVSLVAC